MNVILNPSAVSAALFSSKIAREPGGITSNEIV